MYRVPANHLKTLVDNQERHERKVGKRIVNFTVDDVFGGDLNFPDGVEIQALSSVADTILVGDNVRYSRLNSVHLVDDFQSATAEEIKTNLEDRVQEFVATAGVKLPVVVAIVVPFFVAGAIQREGFYSPESLALLGDIYADKAD